MISIDEAQDLMTTFIELKNRSEETKKEEDIQSFKKHEQLCIKKFYYLISMRTNKYKGFSNYEDLNQEGLEMLVRAMNNYNPNKGNFFWWAHKYIETRIVRSANTHTVIRYPLKFAKANVPHRETKMPVFKEEKNTPDKLTELLEITKVIDVAMENLNDEQRKLVNLVFGVDGDKPMSISKVCRKMKLSRFHCMKMIDGALDVLKKNIRL
jgi:RNA polymerase sigma factor (sigma-70 family)